MSDLNKLYQVKATMIPNGMAWVVAKDEAEAEEDIRYWCSDKGVGELADLQLTEVECDTGDKNLIEKSEGQTVVAVMGRSEGYRYWNLRDLENPHKGHGWQMAVEPLTLDNSHIEKVSFGNEGGTFTTSDFQFKEGEVYLDEDGVEYIFMGIDPTCPDYGIFRYRVFDCTFELPLLDMRPISQGVKVEATNKCYPVYDDLSLSDEDRLRLITMAEEIQDLVCHPSSSLYQPCLHNCLEGFMHSLAEMVRDE